MLTMFLLILSILTFTSAADLHDADSGLEIPDAVASESWILAVGCGVLLLVCGVVILFGCADFCRRDPSFKDFDNEDAFAPDVVTPTSYQGTEFSMYPPTENTPDHVVSPTPVYFEPLPDIAAQRRQQQHHQANTLQLRPKVAMVTRDRADSEDDLDDVMQRDSVQDKVQLQNLLTNSHHQLPRSQLQYIKELGDGWFGKVLQGEGQNILPGHKKTKIVIQMLKEDSDSHDQLAFLQEASPYRDVDHQNVLRLLGQCVETTPYLAVIELCPFGDLKEYLRNHRVAQESFNEKGLLLKFACEMAAGLQALHQQNFIHRDFAIRNCLLASDLSVKVGDYGLSEETYKEDYYTDGNGDAIPIRWLAPECVLYSEEGVLLRSVTKQSNIWSYGVAVWEVITFGAMPYPDLSNEHVLRLVIKEKSVKPNKPDVRIFHLDRVYQLMELCWSDAAQRPSLRELRIMLLHLLSRKDDPDTSAFDQKWNLLMPRRAPTIAKVSGAPKSVSRTGTGSGPSPHQPPVSSNAVRPSGFESDFSDFNGSLVAQAGSFDPDVEEQPLPGVHGYSFDGMTNGNVASPANELSLEAEFSQANLKSQKKAEAVTPANELSLHLELSALGEDDGFKEVPAHLQDVTPQSLGTPDTIDILDNAAGESRERDVDGSSMQSEDKELSERDVGPLAQSTPLKENIPSFSVADSEPGEDEKVSLDLKGPEEVGLTSTPKKADTSDDTAYLTTTQGAIDSAQSSTAYETAQESADKSLGRSISNESNDRSLLGQQKFAAMLQTVAMSYDGETELSTSFNSSGFVKVDNDASLQAVSIESNPNPDKSDSLSGIEEVTDESTFVEVPRKEEIEAAQEVFSEVTSKADQSVADSGLHDSSSRESSCDSSSDSSKDSSKDSSSESSDDSENEEEKKRKSSNDKND